MNSKTNITVTLTRKEAECLRDMADYMVRYHSGDTEEIKYGNRALDKIEAALRCEPASTN
jgi:hypothetical protein